MPSPGLIGRKAPPGQGPIATKRLDTQIKLLLSSWGLAGLAIASAVSAFIYVREWAITGSPDGDLLPVVWPVICLILGGVSIPRLRRKLAALKAQELAERETPSD